MSKIGIDINALTRPKVTGTERYVGALIHALKTQASQEDITLYTRSKISSIEPLPEAWRQKELHWPLPKFWTHGRLSLELITSPPDVCFIPAHEVPFFPGKAKIVTTIHDVAFHYHPEVYSRAGARRQDWAVKRAVEKADAIIAISEATRQDLIKIYGTEEQKVHTVHSAIDETRLQIQESKITETLQKHRLQKQKYFISVGRIEAKKNIKMLLKAFDLFKSQTNSDQVLALGGSFGFGEEEIKKTWEGMQHRQDVRFLGYIEEKDLAPIIKGAAAYLFPSKYEGFGLPALEAMAAETPLVVSGTPALLEIAGNAALIAGTKSEEEWAEAMLRITEDQEGRGILINAGKERLKDFSWQKTAQQTMEVIKSVR